MNTWPEGMLCTVCFKDEYQTITIKKNSGNVECEKCPSCGDIVFTRQQSRALSPCIECGGVLTHLFGCKVPKLD